MLWLLLRIIAILYLSSLAYQYAAPAVRIGASWARTNLHHVQTVCTILSCVCVIVSLVPLQTGLAQLRHVGRRLRRAVVPIRRYTATNGDRGRDHVAPVAARGMPRGPGDMVHADAPLPPPASDHSAPGSFGGAIRPLLDALVEIRDA